MNGGKIHGNTSDGDGGGVSAWDGGTFVMNGGTIYGNAANLPAGVDASLANTGRYAAALCVSWATAKFGASGGHVGSTAYAANADNPGGNETITAP